MPRRSQQGGTEALYSLLEEESLARQKAVRRALKAESRAAKAEAEVEALKEVLLRQGRGMCLSVPLGILPIGTVVTETSRVSRVIFPFTYL